MKSAVFLILFLCLPLVSWSQEIPSEGYEAFIRESWHMYKDDQLSDADFIHELSMEPEIFEKEVQILFQVIKADKAALPVSNHHDRRGVDVHAERLVTALRAHIKKHNTLVRGASLVSTCLKYSLTGILTSGTATIACAIITGSDSMMALAPAVGSAGGLIGYFVGRSRQQICQHLLKLPVPD